MTTRSLTDLRPDVDVEMASHHLELLHLGAEGWISIVLLGAPPRRPAWAFVPVNELVHNPDARQESIEALQDTVDQRWNVYTACGAFRQVPDKGRGSREDIGSLPGVWADLDVKPGVDGYFKTAEEVDQYVKRLPRPTIDVASGTGGRHLYWLVHPDQRPGLQDGEKLLLRWRDYLLAHAEGNAIDHVHDAVRVLRLAGTVRWPRSDETSVEPRPVTIIGEGPRYHLEELLLESETAHAQAEDLRKQYYGQRHNEDQARFDMMQQYSDLKIRRYHATVAYFNIHQDWEQLLTPTGWTLYADHRSQSARCRYWTRPGKDTSDGKSAATDWTDERGDTLTVMTVYTRAPELADLFERFTDNGQVVCSKWNYAVRRLFHGDETALLRSVVQGRGVLA